jgi:hypothetical protein
MTQKLLQLFQLKVGNLMGVQPLGFLEAAQQVHPRGTDHLKNYPC